MNFFDALMQFIGTAFNFLLMLIDGLGKLLSFIPTILGFTGSLAAFLPSFILPFAVVAVTLSLVLRIIGRKEE